MLQLGSLGVRVQLMVVVFCGQLGAVGVNVQLVHLEFVGVSVQLRGQFGFVGVAVQFKVVF